MTASQRGLVGEVRPWCISLIRLVVFHLLLFAAIDCIEDLAESAYHAYNYIRGYDSPHSRMMR